jgi:hypothetical protein
MKHTVLLRQVASARAGDKRNTSSISVWPYDPRHYDDIKASLTAERVKAAFPQLITGEVERYELDELKGLNFVLRGALEGGVNSSLNLDAHGKSFSFLLLSLPVEVRLHNEPQQSASELLRQEGTLPRECEPHV